MAEYSRPDRLAALAERLLALTKAGTITWSEADTEDTYVYATESSAVGVRNRDGDDRHPYLLLVFDGDGRIVDSLLTRWSDSGVEVGDSNETIRQLYELARKSASSIDAVLDVLFDELPPL